MSPTVAQVLAGRYRLLHVLARGGMGSVWIAEDLPAGRLVAVKLMDPAIAGHPEARARFLHEARAASLLRSPHVVEVLDHGLDGATAYIVMELLHGEDLDTALRRDRRISPIELAPLLRHVCKALELAHAAGIVHRDLKPGNIFLAHVDDGRVAKVLDFGIAKALRTDIVGPGTKTGTLLGSPHYMSPEQARCSKDVDHRSDLWALGVVVFRAVTGRLPFPGSEVGDVIVKVCADPVPVPSAIAPDLGPGVDRFIERALARDPEQRFQTARSMVETFAALVGAPLRWDDPMAPPGPPQPSSPTGEPPPRAIRFGDPPLLSGGHAREEASDHARPFAGESQGTLAPAGRSASSVPRHIPKAAIGLVALGLIAVAIGVHFQGSRPATDAVGLPGPSPMDAIPPQPAASAIPTAVMPAPVVSPPSESPLPPPDAGARSPDAGSPRRKPIPVDPDLGF